MRLSDNASDPLLGARDAAQFGSSDTSPQGDSFSVYLGAAELPASAAAGDSHLQEPRRLAGYHECGDASASPDVASVKPDGADLRSILISMLGSSSRSESVEKLANGLAIALPGNSIRCAIGSQRLRRFYDARLGWLGPESALHRELASRWSLLTGESATPCLVDSQMMICLRRPNRPDHCLIWISGDGVSDELLHDLDLWTATMAASLWSRPIRSILKPLESSWVNRWWIGAAVLGVLVLLVLPIRYRVACAVKIEPLFPRVVSAPFEAIIEEVLVHPGDSVAAGQTLVRFDGRPLRLELQSLEAEIHHVVKQKDVAMATGRVAESQQAQLRYQQLVRQRDLIDRRLAQLAVVSPIDGIVVSGDLRRAVGSPLELGRVLMEVAPLDRVLVEIEIPEYEISMVHCQSPARLRIDASRTPTIGCELVEIYPAGELRNDQMVFVAPLEIDNAQGAFRPGMTGKATVYGGYRPLAWPYVRKALDQVTWLAGL